MESQHYRGVEREFRQEVQRVADNTERTEKELEKYRYGIREKAERRFEPRRKSIDTKRERLDRDEKDIEKLYQDEERKLETYFGENETAIRKRGRDLEERYIKRRKEINREQREVGETILEVEFFESTEKEYRDKENRIELDIKQIRGRIDRNIKYRETISDKFDQLEDKERDRVKKEKREIKEQRENIPTIFKEKERELESEFEKIGKRRIEQIENENYGESSEFSTVLKKILNTRNLLNDWDEKQLNFERNRTAWKCFREGSYKNWN